MHGAQGAEPKKHFPWGLYPIPVFALVFVAVLYCFLSPSITLTLDGYSHLFSANILKEMLSGNPDVHTIFDYNSPLIPNWLVAILLAALSNIFPAELALKLLVVLIWSTVLVSLYFCLNVSAMKRYQQAQVLMILLPFSLNAFLTYGFYGFVISTSMCFFVLGFIARHGVTMPIRFRLATTGLLLIAYFFHPLPVLASFLFPFAHWVTVVRIQRLESLRSIASSLRLHAFASWPWVPPLVLIFWFTRELSHSKEVPHYSLIDVVSHRIFEFAGDAILSISLSPGVGLLFVALLGVLFASIFLTSREPPRGNCVVDGNLAVLLMASLAIYMVVPYSIGDGQVIPARFLLNCIFFLALFALNRRPLDSRLLTLCSVIAALSVLGFAGEYLRVAKLLSTGVAELQSAMDSVPRHSRVLILSYRMTPNCTGLPLLERIIPERHLALAGMLKSQAIVLNNYQGNTTHFPLKYRMFRNSVPVEDEFREEKTHEWEQLLTNGSEASYIVSFGVPSRSFCENPVNPPLEETLRIRHDLVFSRESLSRVQLWRKRQ
jgi:hypothetical protein